MMFYICILIAFYVLIGFVFSLTLTITFPNDSERKQALLAIFWPFSCQHSGYGIFCHRCAQAKEIETRALALEEFFKTNSKDSSKINKFCAITEEQGAQKQRLEVSACTQKFTGQLKDVLERMRQESKRLLTKKDESNG